MPFDFRAPEVESDDRQIKLRCRAETMRAAIRFVYDCDAGELSEAPGSTAVRERAHYTMIAYRRQDGGVDVREIGRQRRENTEQGEE